MPQMETADRVHKALYWEFAGTDSNNEPVVLAPVELMVRWVPKHREVRRPDATPISIDVTASVDRRIPKLSCMWVAPDQEPGSATALEQWTGTGSGAVETEVMQVVLYSESSDLKGRSTRREVSLARYGRSPPQVV